MNDLFFQYILICLYIQDVRRLKPKILVVVSLTKNKTKIFCDVMLFDARVSSKTSLNLRIVATSRF
jgi:hypothetical protein